MLRYHLRHAVRLLWRDKPLTASVVFTLALGFGANSAVFSVIEAALLRPLPYPESDRLVVLGHRDSRTGLTKAFIARGDFIDLAARQQVFERLDGYGNFQAALTAGTGPLRVRGLSATPGLLRTLRAEVVAGRTLGDADGRPGAAPVMILGHHIWVSQFGSDPNVIGRSLRLGNTDRQVVGIASPGFRFPAGDPVDVIAPIPLPPTAPAERKSGWIFCVARLKSGVTLDQAQLNLATLSAEFEKAYPTQNQGSVYYATRLRDELVGDSRPALLLMFAAVGVLLLVACANVANLLLARAISRRPEMALRSTLGAGRIRLAIQLFSESLVLGSVGLGVGLLVAWFGVPALVALVPASVAVPGLEQSGLNVTVLGYSCLTMLVTTVAFGLVGLATTRGPASLALDCTPRVGVSRQTRRWSSALVVAEIALAAVLMVAAGLVLRSFAGLLAIDPGFRTDGVLVVNAQLPAGRYQSEPLRESFYRQAFDALRQAPGVQSVGAAAVVPLTGNNWSVPFERADRRVPTGQRPPDVGWQQASAGYFDALRIPLKSGRLFNASDGPQSAPVVIISEAIERQFFAGETAVGKRVITDNGAAEIIGVVGSIRRATLEEQPRADMYFPFERSPQSSVPLFIRSSSNDAAAILPEVQARLRAIDPGVAILEATTLDDVSRRSVAVSRLAVWLLGVFAAVGLALAAIGVYSVLAYHVRQRSREIGTRVALGATAQSIFRMILGESGRLVVSGLALGLGAGVVAARSLGSLLFNVPVADPLTLMLAALTLVIAMSVASFLPARQAAMVDPARTIGK